MAKHSNRKAKSRPREATRPNRLVSPAKVRKGVRRMASVEDSAWLFDASTHLGLAAQRLGGGKKARKLAAEAAAVARAAGSKKAARKVLGKRGRR